MPALSRLRSIEAGPALLGAVVVALVWASVGGSYATVWGRQVGGHSVADWVSDGPMVLFFLLIGMEVKAELVAGRLSTARTAAVPVVAALGGMAVPALVYLALNGGGAGAHGWAVPMATDVAVAAGVLALLGDRVPSGVGVLLLALAVVDDIGAIVVIALVYADAPSLPWLALAGLGLAAIGLLRRLDRAVPPLVVALGLVVWFATFRSGVHATIAGVALGLLVPTGAVHGLAARLRPWTDLVIVPLFALSHAGVDLTSPVVGQAASSPVAWGAGLGLALGKPIGIAGATLLAVRTGLGRLPDQVTTRHVVGLGALAGVGFTVSLFVAGLAFDRAALVDEATVGVLAGSVVAALVGILLLLRRAGATDPASSSR